MSLKGSSTKTNPIKDKEKLKKLFSLPGWKGLAFAISSYTSLRGGEIFRSYAKSGVRPGLHWKDVIENGKARSRIRIFSSKQKLIREIPVHPALAEIIQEHYDQLRPDLSAPMFPASRGTSAGKNITLDYWNRTIKEEMEKVGLQPSSSHCFRKTLARSLYDQTNDLALVQTFLKHRDSATTLRYIGYEVDDIEAAIHKIEL